MLRLVTCESALVITVIAYAAFACSSDSDSSLRQSTDETSRGGSSARDAGSLDGKAGSSRLAPSSASTSSLGGARGSSSAKGDTSEGGSLAQSGASSGGAPSEGSSKGETALGEFPGRVTKMPVTCRKTADGVTTIAFVNGCNGTLSVRGSNGVSDELSAGENLCVNLGTDKEALSALRYWGFIGEDPGGEHHTLAELTLNTDFHDFDWYNLSHVDAHNLPLQIVPIDALDCRTLSCDKSLLADCPKEGLYRDSSGKVIACVSPDRNNSQSPVAQYFDAACQDAYSWSGDDAQSMAACAGEDFDVVFCP